MGIAACVELVPGAFQIAPHSVLREPQYSSAFPSGLAFRDPLQAFELARGKMPFQRAVPLQAQHLVMEMCGQDLKVAQVEELIMRPVAISPVAADRK